MEKFQLMKEKNSFQKFSNVSIRLDITICILMINQRIHCLITFIFKKWLKKNYL